MVHSLHEVVAIDVGPSPEQQLEDGDVSLGSGTMEGVALVPTSCLQASTTSAPETRGSSNN